MFDFFLKVKPRINLSLAFGREKMLPLPFQWAWNRKGAKRSYLMQMCPWVQKKQKIMSKMKVQGRVLRKENRTNSSLKFMNERRWGSCFNAQIYFIVLLVCYLVEGWEGVSNIYILCLFRKLRFFYSDCFVAAVFICKQKDLYCQYNNKCSDNSAFP